MTEPAADALPSYADLARRPGASRGTAWGLFGEGDQLGTLNHLSPQRVREAARLVREGSRFGLDLPLDFFDPPLVAHRGVLQHHVFGLDEFHRDERIDGLFTQAASQLDGLRHFAHPDHGFYGGTPGEDIAAGTPALGIQHVAERGIAGRGLLVDLAGYRETLGRPLDHDGSEAVDVNEIEDVLAWQGSELLPGDILMIRFGWIEWFRSLPAESHQPARSAGLAAREATAAWLWDRRVALVAGDNIALEAWPVKSPPQITTRAELEGRQPLTSHTGMLHRLLIPLLGMSIGELWNLDDLRDACRSRRRYESFVTAAPLNLPGGVASTANALALL